MRRGRLLRALPALVVVRADALGSPVIALPAEEIVRDAPGQEAVLDRLLDLLLIAALLALALARRGAGAGLVQLTPTRSSATRCG